MTILSRELFAITRLTAQDIVFILPFALIPATVIEMRKLLRRVFAIKWSKAVSG